MSESLKHFIPKYVTEKRYDKVKSILFYALFVQIFTSFIISLFFFFGADFIATHYFKTEVAK
jgi:Na+-driven multidrug efflux pump